LWIVKSEKNTSLLYLLVSFFICYINVKKKLIFDKLKSVSFCKGKRWGGR